MITANLGYTEITVPYSADSNVGNLSAYTCGMCALTGTFSSIPVLNDCVEMFSR